ncbi:MAG: hypothetical protein U0105_00985 [Candidatus Obscuribacterales bacterium]
MKHPDRPRVLITVNPGLIQGNRFSTVRSIVTALDACSNLLLLPIDEYDFKNKKARAYKRIAGGKFKFVKTISPQADLWVVYTDGYYLDFRSLGFASPTAYIQAQMSFHLQCEIAGKIGLVVNSVAGEKCTLKRFFATLDHRRFHTIETHIAKTTAEVADLQKKEGVLIAKPNWSGGGYGVEKLTSEKEVKDFCARSRLSEFCFQPLALGEEKRFWFAGNQCVAARRIRNRRAPWMDKRPDGYLSRPYDASAGGQFARDLKIAETMWARTGLSVGSVDFIGEQINELNGCGTTYIDYDGWQKIVDARKPLVDYLVSVVRSLQ